MVLASSLPSRGWLFVSLLSVVAMSVGPAAAYPAEPGKFWVFVGTYTNGKSKGIYRMVLDTLRSRESFPGADARRRSIEPVVPGRTPDGEVPLCSE